MQIANTKTRARNPYSGDSPLLAKLTSKNQLTLPKAAVEVSGGSEYFEIEVRACQLVLTPARIQRADGVRAKLDALGLSDSDLADAVNWARSSAKPKAVPRINEPATRYLKSPSPAKTAPNKRSR